MFILLSGISSFTIAEDQTIAGNLTVNGTADILGNVANIGSWAGDTSRPGITFNYIEANGVSTITFDASRNTNDWLWRHNTVNGLINGMKLDSVHRLILLGGDGATPGITLDPSGSSTIAGSLVVNGTSVTFPNQQLSGNTSVLTQGLGDARYMRLTGSNWSVGTNAAPVGTGSFALGNNTVAIGDSSAASFALGSGAVAKAYTLNSQHIGGVAIGNAANVGDTTGNGGGVAIGNSANCVSTGVALGMNSISSNGAATAIGYDSRANASNSTSIGWSSIVAGYKAQAFGGKLLVSGYGATAVGMMNADSPNATWNTRVPTDFCFMVGNGIEPEMGTETRSNAFAIQWNGDATHYGNVTVTKKVTATQGARFDDTVRIAPRGGLSMGAFTYEP